jgi:regulator of extracellular matrix RemA (YlzA/DUF370 family)
MSNKQSGMTGRPEKLPEKFSGKVSGKVGPAVNIGYNNFVVTDRIIAILESGSLPMKRLREKAGENSCLVDATAGRKMRSLIVTDSNHIVVSALAPQTLQERLQQEKNWSSVADLERKDGEFVS